jgi:hypothetical protein
MQTLICPVSLVVAYASGSQAWKAIQGRSGGRRASTIFWLLLRTSKQSVKQCVIPDEVFDLPAQMLILSDLVFSKG